MSDLPDNAGPDREEQDGPEYREVAGPVHPLTLRLRLGTGQPSNLLSVNISLSRGERK